METSVREIKMADPKGRLSGNPPLFLIIPLQSPENFMSFLIFNQ